MQANTYKRRQPVRLLSFTGPRFDNDWSETGQIVKPDVWPDWYIVRFDAGGGTLCVHASRITPTNLA